MKRILTFILLCTITLFLSGNQVVITQNYNFIVTNQSTFNFSTGALTSDVKYQRTNKIAITNDKVLADPLKYHYAFFWDEADAYLGYYKTNRGITTSGTYLGQVNTQSIPLPLNAYSFALVRYDNDYVLVGNYTIEDLFIDNNLDYDNLPDFNEIPIPELNNLTLNEVFDDGEILLLNNFTSPDLVYVGATGTVLSNILNFNPNGSRTDPRIAINNNPGIVGNTYYTSIKYKPNVVNFNQIVLFGNFSTTFITNVATLNNYIREGRTTTISTATQSIFRFDYSTLTDALNGSIDFEHIFLYNLTALGIDNLTQAQMDRYYELYENPINWIYYKTDGNVSSVDNHYYAAGKNLFDYNNPTGFSNVTTTAIPNGVRITTTSNGQFRSLNYAPYHVLLPNTQYRMSYNSVRNTGTSGGGIRIVNSTSTVLLGGTFNTLNGSFTFTTPSDGIINVLLYATGTVVEAGDVSFTNIQIEQGATATTYEAYAAPTDLLNLTLLFGVGNKPDLATSDTYYAAYEEYLQYDFVLPLTFANQTLSYEEFYFDDGVSTEIERLGSILIFTLIGFTLMIFGFVSNRRIFNLLSIGAFVVLGVLLVEFVGFLIILFGLIFLNVYYTFFGEL